MIKNITSIIKKKIEYVYLSLILFITLLITTNVNIEKQKNKENFNELLNNVFFKKTLNSIYSKAEQKYKKVEHTIVLGETFNSILQKYSVGQAQINDLTNILKKKININKLNNNKIITFIIDQSDDKIIEFTYPLSKTEKVVLFKNDLDEKYSIKKITTKLNRELKYKENVISKSLYSSAIKENIPINTIISFAGIYGFQVDFQRDIKKNDSFQILYEVFTNSNQEIVEVGSILYANLILSGQENKLYYYKEKDFIGHYDLSGKSVKKALMKTPINGARLSSQFGMRKHPIDGYNKMHKGTDFAAPIGTPIMASGDGMIEKMGWCGGGGNCIKLKHNSTYQTVYAHMSKFASGLRTGIRVKQGQIIGYVGSTGKSTGPHLHYEVIKNKKHINPQTLKLPSGKILKGENRRKFEIEKLKTDVLKSELIFYKS